VCYLGHAVPGFCRTVRHIRGYVTGVRKSAHPV
jgi:hypothetical protein